MTVNHVFYIPLILALGVLVGAFLGRRQLRQKMLEEERVRRELETRRAERERRKAARGAGAQPEDDRA